MSSPDDRSVTVHVVAHTHWDREWYHGVERFRARLVALVDELLDDPPPDGESFLLDGQAILLDDYLRVRPERAGELAQLLRDGRLEAGPWYVLADGLIPSAEALVRNLLLGREAVRRLRGEAPPVLYCPDAFGHPAILPELAAGFGCDVVVAWRGYGGSRWPSGDTVRWRGPGGHEVLLHHLAPSGYELGSSLPVAPDGARQRWQELAAVLLPRASTRVVLLPNGADHHARQRGQGEAVRELARAAEPHVVRASSLRAWAGDLASSAKAAALPMIGGELRDSYGYTWTLAGTLGSRAAQKRDNARVERLLVRDVEPWVALLPGGGGAATRALLREAWRTVLECHPHDTLCGTATDDVAAAFDHRMRSAAEQARAIRDEALPSLLEHDAERAREDTAAWRPMVQLRNPVARPRSGVVDLTLTTVLAKVAVGPGSGGRQGERQEPATLGVAGMLVQRLASREYVSLVESPRAYPLATLVREERALGWVSDMRGYTVETRAHGNGEESAPATTVHVAGGTMSNGLVEVTIADDGVVTLKDVTTGRSVHDLLALEVSRDIGDLYTPAIRERAPAPEFQSVEWTHAGLLRGECRIAYVLRAVDGSEAGAARVTFQLDAGLAAMRVAVSGESRMDDARLRISFRTDLPESRVIADAAFHPAGRQQPMITPDDAAMEHLVPTAPLHRWVSRYSVTSGASLVSDGLAEYEALDDGGIAVTLVRAVATLSRFDLPERPGHAGWPTDTPAAQSHGPFEATFAVALHGPDSPAMRTMVEQLAEDVLLPLTGATVRSNLEPPQVRGGAELVGDGLAFSAILPAQQPGWIALRCVNRRSESTVGRWVLGRAIREATYARLDETPTSPIQVDGASIPFEAAAGEIVTILAR